MVVQFEWGTELYAKAVNLRDKILRKPLGMHFTQEQLEKEKDYFHIGLLDENEKMISVLYLMPVDEKTIQLKQMAVDNDVQKNGFGRLLVEYALIFSALKGFEQMILHARIEAVGFYEKLNFQIIGDKFLEIGIEHYKMIKKIK